MLSPDTKLLRATVSDMKVAREAIADVKLSSSHHRLELDEVALHEFLSDPGHYLILAISNGKVLGSLYGYALRHLYRREPQFFIYGIDVRVEHQSRGVGTALVERFISETRREDAFEVWVLTNHTNVPAMAMYTRAGLKRCGDVGTGVVSAAREQACTLRSAEEAQRARSSLFTNLMPNTSRSREERDRKFLMM